MGYQPGTLSIGGPRLSEILLAQAEPLYYCATIAMISRDIAVHLDNTQTFDYNRIVRLVNCWTL